MKYHVTAGEQKRTVEVERVGERYAVTVDGVRREVDLLRPTPEAFQMLIDGESWEAGCVPREGGYLVDVMGTSAMVEVSDPRRAALRLAAGAAGGTVSTQMPGRIVRILVAVGDTVRKGQPVVVVEAMKMENELKAPLDGVIDELMVREGQTVEAGSKLVRVKG